MRFRFNVELYKRKITHIIDITMTQRSPIITLYPIAAASRLTGISVHTLRMWERRYGLKPSQRSGTRRRLYDRNDIQKLILLKALVDRGQSIGRIAGMSIEDLEQQLYEIGDLQAPPRANQPVIQISVALFGSSLLERVASEIITFDDIKLIHKSANFEGNEHILKTNGLDVAVLERPTLHLETLRNIQSVCLQYGFPNIVVIFNYAAQSTVRRFRENGFMLLRMPVSSDEVRLACLASTLKARTRRRTSLALPHLPTENQAVPPPRFDPNTLQIIGSATTQVECECPKHLVELIRSLSTFELYSKQCESRDEKDAALHAFVGDITGHARALMETALERVATAEGLIPDNTNNTNHSR